MKHYFLHVFILVLLPVAAVFAQPRYSVEKIPLCWTVGSTDSSITKVVLISSASDQLVTIGYYNADGNDITVSGGSLQFGYCGTGGGGGGGDDDWRWYGAVETYAKPLYRIGKTNIFVTNAADTTHGFRVDSTFQFRMDGGTNIFDWQVGGGTGTDYTPHAGLFYRAPNTFESSLVGAGENNLTIGAADNTISDRDRLGALIFAGKNPAGTGGYRPGAMITAFADVPTLGWSADSSATSLNFYVTRPNQSTLTNVFTMQRDGRFEMDRYQFFEDGVPERMLGFDNGTDDATVHTISGTPGANSLLGLNSTGSGMEWKEASEVANLGLRYTVYQPAHGFTIPAHGFVPVYRDSTSGWELALANDTTKLHSAYVVEVINADSIVLMEAGILTITGGHGLDVGKDYFLTNAGNVATTPGFHNDWLATVWDTLTIALKATRPVLGAVADTTTYLTGGTVFGGDVTGYYNNLQLGAGVVSASNLDFTPLTGSGTANRSARYTGLNVLGNGSFSDDGARVTALTPLRLLNWTTGGRPATPLSGDIGYNTTLGMVEGYNTGWQQMMFPSGNNLSTIRHDGTKWVENSYLKSSATQTWVNYATAPAAGSFGVAGSVVVGSVENDFIQIGSGGSLTATFTPSTNGSGRLTAGGGVLSYSGSEWRHQANFTLSGTGRVFKFLGSSQQFQSANGRTGFIVNEINTQGTRIFQWNLAESLLSDVNGNTAAVYIGLPSRYYRATLGTQNGTIIGTLVRQSLTADTSSAVRNKLIAVSVEPTFNQNGIVNVDKIGIDYNPGTVTGTHYALLIRSGLIGIGTTTPTANVDIDGSQRLRAISTPGSVEDGEMWTSSTQKALVSNQAGINQTLSGVIFTGTADATNGNSGSEVSITPTGVGTLTLPANALVAGKMLRITASGSYGTDAVFKPDLEMRIKLGSTTIAGFGPNEVATNTTTGLWTVSFTITCRTTGVSGTVVGRGELHLNSSEVVGEDRWITTNNSTVTLNTTTSQAITITTVWTNGADVDDTITTNQFLVEILN